MNLKRAIWVGALTYIASFIIGALVLSLLGYELAQGSEVSTPILVINIVITIIIAVLFTLLYFKKVKASGREGLYFGITLVILGTILDAIIFSIAATAGQSISLAEYYSNPLFWLALFLFIVTTILVGVIK